MLLLKNRKGLEAFAPCSMPLFFSSSRPNQTKEWQSPSLSHFALLFLGIYTCYMVELFPLIGMRMGRLTPSLLVHKYLCVCVCFLSVDVYFLFECVFYPTCACIFLPCSASACLSVKIAEPSKAAVVTKIRTPEPINTPSLTT